MKNKTYLSRAELLNTFKNIGIIPGMGLVVHSSLKSFGYVEGGAHTIIEVLMELITAQGTLLMPSFNHGIIFLPGKVGYYDPEQTPTINGIIPDTFWRMPGVLRSLDPTHPVAAWGKNALRYVQNHHRTLTMGPESPLGLLWRDGGSCLLLGVGSEANTFHHVVEMTTGAHCLGLRTEGYPVKLTDGRRIIGRTWGWRGGICPITDKGIYFSVMEGSGYLIKEKVGESDVILYSLNDCYKILAPLLQQGIKGVPSCHDCPINPRQVEQTVESDWDKENQRLHVNSIAWTY
jgi:aminoglycoside N3'-acetyltransferase